MSRPGPEGLQQAILELRDLTERLRRECPWDREQTAVTIVPHTVEEAYEVADAALAGDDEQLLDELGDLLFQVYFLALLLEERGRGSLEQAARRIHAKLVRRHPHVFGEGDASSPGAVRVRWEQLKRDEEERAGIFHDVPDALPALLHARKVQQRVVAVGYDWVEVGPMLDKVEEELRELRDVVPPAPESEPDARVAGELGDVLFTVVNVARRLNVDPELALRQTTRKFRARVERAERLAASRGEEWSMLPLDEQERYYEEAKEHVQ